MRQLLLFVWLLCSASLWAQPDRGSGSLNIPPVNFPEEVPDVSPTPEKPNQYYVPPSIKGDPIPNRGIDLEPRIQFPNSGQTFINPGDAVKEKLNKKLHGGEGEMYKVLRQNLYFGDFRTQATRVAINCRDHEAEDGDLIRIWVNGRIYVEQIMLTNHGQTIMLDLAPGFNKIEFEALNQGTSGPNTAQFIINDNLGNNIHSNRWDLATGYRASIIIVREEPKSSTTK